VISIYTAELLPTSCRSTIMGICSQASRLGSVCAPFLLMLGAQLGSVGGYSQVCCPSAADGQLGPQFKVPIALCCSRYAEVDCGYKEDQYGSHCLTVLCCDDLLLGSAV
jgi:hypothetical protein